MMKEKEMELKLTRDEICDLMFACAIAHQRDPRAEKWVRFIEKLKEARNELDKAYISEYFPGADVSEFIS